MRDNAFDPGHLHVHIGDGCRQRLEPLPAASDDDQVVTVGGEALGECLADTRGRPGDQSQ